MRLPQVFIWVSLSETNSYYRVDVSTPEEGVEIPCQITPSNPSVAYKDWNIEVMEPYLLFCSLCDGENMQVGDRGSSSGKNYTIKGIKLWKAGINVSFAEILLDADQYGGSI